MMDVDKIYFRSIYEIVIIYYTDRKPLIIRSSQGNALKLLKQLFSMNGVA